MAPLRERKEIVSEAGKAVGRSCPHGAVLGHGSGRLRNVRGAGGRDLARLSSDVELCHLCSCQHPGRRRDCTALAVHNPFAHTLSTDTQRPGQRAAGPSDAHYARAHSAGDSPNPVATSRCDSEPTGDAARFVTESVTDSDSFYAGWRWD